MIFPWGYFCDLRSHRTTIECSFLFFLHSSIKTSLFTCMAGRTDRLNSNQKRVFVTIHVNIDDPLNISRGRTFVPQLLATARPEMSFFCFQSESQCLGIYIGQH